jgi:DNA-binding transcriptional LysR family regulator
VDPHLLRTFVTVVRLGSFSAAATELGYTQAAVSQQIATLETDLKITLLTRRPVTPTEAGARLLEHAGPILLRIDAARADLRRMTQTPAATLVVGVTPLATMARGGLVPGEGGMVAVGLAAVRQRMPRTDVTVRLGSRPAVATGVARGELDIGLIDGLAAPGDSLPVLAPLSAIGVGESELGIVVPADHPLAGRAGLRLADLVDARWIDAPDVAPLSDVRRVAGTEGFRAALRYEGTDILSLVALAAAGHGLTLVPAWVAGAREGAGVKEVAGAGRIVAVRVTDPQVVHRVEVIHGTLRMGSAAAELAALL